MAFQRGGTSHPTGPTQAITISAMTAPIQKKAISRGRENQRTCWIKEERATAEVCLGKRFPLRTQEACIFIVIKNNKALDAIQITRPGRSGSDRSAEARQHQNRGGRKNRLPRPRPNRRSSPDLYTGSANSDSSWSSAHVGSRSLSTDGGSSSRRDGVSAYTARTTIIGSRGRR